MGKNGDILNSSDLQAIGWPKKTRMSS